MIDGEYIEYYLSGEIKYKCFYLDGKLHGESIYYFKSGDIASISNYLCGDTHGECIYYHASGKIYLKSLYIYSKGVTELEWLSYNRNIKLELIGL